MDEAKILAQIAELSSRLERLEAMVSKNNSTVAAEAQHFSQVAATESALDLSPYAAPTTPVPTAPTPAAPAVASPSVTEPYQNVQPAPTTPPVYAPAPSAGVPVHTPANAQPFQVPEAALPLSASPVQVASESVTPQPQAFMTQPQPVPASQPAPVSQPVATPQPKSTSSLESFIGRYVLAGLAGLLLVIGAITFTVLVWDYISDWFKLGTVAILAIVLSVVGITLAKLKPKVRVVAAALSGMGSALGFVAILSAALYFKFISPETVLPLTIVWSLLLVGSTYVSKDLFTPIITSVGVAITLIVGVAWTAPHPTTIQIASLSILVLAYNVGLFAVFFFAFDEPRWMVPMVSSYVISILGILATSLIDEFFAFNRGLGVLAQIVSIAGFIFAKSNVAKISTVVMTALNLLIAGPFFMSFYHAKPAQIVAYLVGFSVVVIASLTLVALTYKRSPEVSVKKGTLVALAGLLSFSPIYASFFVPKVRDYLGWESIPPNQWQAASVIVLLLAAMLMMIEVSFLVKPLASLTVATIGLFAILLFLPWDSLSLIITSISLVVTAFVVAIIAQLRVPSEATLPEVYRGRPEAIYFLNRYSFVADFPRVAFLIVGSLGLYFSASNIYDFVTVSYVIDDGFSSRGLSNFFGVFTCSVLLIALVAWGFVGPKEGILPNSYSGYLSRTYSDEEWAAKLSDYANNLMMVPVPAPRRGPLITAWVVAFMALLLNAVYADMKMWWMPLIALLALVAVFALLTWRLTAKERSTAVMIVPGIAAWLICENAVYTLTGWGMDSVISSIIALVFGAAFVLAGFTMVHRPLRIFGLVMVLVSVLKIVTLDIRGEGSIFRVAMLMVGAVLCLLISLGYTLGEKRLAKPVNTMPAPGSLPPVNQQW